MFYFLPEKPGSLKSRIEELDLGYAFKEGHLTKADCKNGPGAENGSIICRSDAPWSDFCGFYPDNQEWRKIPKSKAWIGRVKDRQYTPAEFARPTLLPGQMLKLEDGLDWLVPIARRWMSIGEATVYSTALPCRAKLSDDGVWIDGEVKERYRPLWDLVMGYNDAYIEAMENASEDEDLVNFEYPMGELAIATLRTNYYVSHVEADVLNIYSEDAQAAIINVALDEDGLVEIIKKKGEPDSSSS